MCIYIYIWRLPISSGSGVLKRRSDGTPIVRRLPWDRPRALVARSLASDGRWWGGAGRQREGHCENGSGRRGAVAAGGSAWWRPGSGRTLAGGGRRRRRAESQFQAREFSCHFAGRVCKKNWPGDLFTGPGQVRALFQVRVPEQSDLSGSASYTWSHTRFQK